VRHDLLDRLNRPAQGAEGKHVTRMSVGLTAGRSRPMKSSWMLIVMIALYVCV
jgi:hypothetical protein